MVTSASTHTVGIILQSKPLYIAFFDLTKAFDTITQEALWSIILHFGCTMKFVTVLHLLHNHMEVVLMTNGSTTDPIPHSD
eukprot:g44764.t1